MDLIIGILVLGIIWSGIKECWDKANRDVLRKQLKRIGDMRGYSYTQAVRALGRPTFVQTFHCFRTVVWSAYRYNITLTFENDRCTGVIEQGDPR